MVLWLITLSGNFGNVGDAGDGRADSPTDSDVKTNCDSDSELDDDATQNVFRRS